MTKHIKADLGPSRAEPPHDCISEADKPSTHNGAPVLCARCGIGLTRYEHVYVACSDGDGTLAHDSCVADDRAKKAEAERDAALRRERELRDGRARQDPHQGEVMIRRFLDWLARRLDARHGGRCERCDHLGEVHGLENRACMGGPLEDCPCCEFVGGAE